MRVYLKNEVKNAFFYAKVKIINIMYIKIEIYFLRFRKHLSLNNIYITSAAQFVIV